MRPVRYKVKADGSERRQHPRHDDQFFIRVFGDDASTPELCELIDISIGGLALKAPSERLVSVDSILVVELPLGRSMTRLRTRAKVVNITMQEIERLHLQFVDESKLFQNTLQACIEDWAARLTEVHPQPHYTDPR